MTHRIFLCASALLLLTGCAQMASLVPAGNQTTAEASSVDAAAAAPPVAPAPPADAASEEAFDTTSAEDRARAAAPAAGGAELLGSTVASLGDPTKPGFWLETPLVEAPAQGRVELVATGKSAQVELIPIAGAASAGSRISLPAMRLIEAPLTDLATLRVFRN